MSAYPPLNDIEIKWRASGSGVCVIVEGETEQDDAWFYNTWFGNRAREVTFFPQNGLEKVASAVTVLRTGLGSRRVYGIVDRDFAVNPMPASVPSDGIMRTPKYTLENYLLDPACWFKYIRPHTLRVQMPGWSTAAEVQATIESLYRQCAPLSAYNWTLHQVRDRDYKAFTALRQKDSEYREHPKALVVLGDIPAHLHGIGAQMGLADDLGQMYAGRLASLKTAPLPRLEEAVSGKYVLNLLREQFPLKPSGKQAWDGVLSAYIDACPDPPADLAHLVDLILNDAHR